MKIVPDILIEAVAQTTLIQKQTREIYASKVYTYIPTINNRDADTRKGFSERDPSKASLVAPDLKALKPREPLCETHSPR